MINPSLTGEFEGKGRFILNYRNQWRSLTKNPYQTYAFSSDLSFLKKKLALGLLLFNDAAGDGRLSNTQVSISLATRLQMSKRDFIKLGIQASWTQRRINIENLTWNSQYDGNTINPNLLSGEPAYLQRSNYFDFATGMLWTHQFYNETKFNLGFSAFHVNQPKYSFLNSSDKLHIRWCGNGDIIIHLRGDNLSMIPSLLFMQQGSVSEFDIGTVFRYDLGTNSRYTGLLKTSSLFAGLFYRYNDALIIYTRFDYKRQLDVCVSYDVNLSKLRSASQARGGIELSVAYIIPERQPLSH